MPDRDPLDLDGQFARYRADLLPHIVGPGPEAARRTVRHRRHTTVVGTTAALAVLLVVGPIAGYAATRHDNGPPPDPTGSDGPTTTAAPTPSPTSARPDPSPTATPPDGRLSRARLIAASRIDLPAWPAESTCRDGETPLREGPVSDGDNVLVEVDHTDLDGDGATETVALIRCTQPGLTASQVVALELDARGDIVTIGQVTRSSRAAPQWLEAVDARPDGSVRVDVADLAPGSVWPLAWSQRQWRTYRWDGQRFDQTAGPTSFGPNPHVLDVSVHATDLSFGAERSDGSRVGTTTVTVRNLAPVTMPGVDLRLGLQPGVRRDGKGWSACSGDPKVVGEMTCVLGPLRPGASRTVVLGVWDRHSTQGVGFARVVPLGPDHKAAWDPDKKNNESKYVYR